MSKQLLFMLGLIFWLGVLWAGVVICRDNPYALVLIALLASPVTMFLLRLTIEGGTPIGMFHPATQSWAFLGGDILFLPLAFFAVGLGQQSIPSGSWFLTVPWLAICVLLGLAAGFGFHFFMEVGAYTNAGHEAALMSPTKLEHDFVAYPLLFGALIYLGVPVLIHNFLWMGVVALAGVLLWGAMAAMDAVKQPEPRHMHPKWDTVRFTTIT